MVRSVTKSRGFTPDIDDELIAYIRQFRKSNGYSPALSEMAQFLGVSSKNTAKVRLSRLAREGRVKFKPGLSRTVTVR